MRVIKRDGTAVPFDRSKIEIAIRKANHETRSVLRTEQIRIVVSEVASEFFGYEEVTVEQIQDAVVRRLENKHAVVALNYQRYREQRAVKREENEMDKSISGLMAGSNIEVGKENSNKNPTLLSTQRDLIAGEVSKDILMRKILPKHLVKAHEDGIVHFHDSDYRAMPYHNCCLVNLEDMLQNGTVINNKLIERPKSFQTACTVATQIVAQVASSQLGGQTISLSHLAPFVDVSRKKYRTELVSQNIEYELNLDKKQIDRIVEDSVRKEIKDGVQTIQYQVETLSSQNGQSPFLTVFLYLGEVEEGQIKDDLAIVIEEVLRQRTKGTKNVKGVYVAPAFPKLIMVLEEDNIRPDSKYYYLVDLAARCTARRLVPDYVSEKKMKELKQGQCFPMMGCRSTLSNWYDEEGNHKAYGRFNTNVQTINLPDVALSSGGDVDKFWKILDERLELVREMALIGHKHLRGTLSDVAPIIWQHGAVARLKPGETIDELLFGGYSTLSLGYAGLYEMTKYMTGHSHTHEEGKQIALDVMQRMNDKCDEWNKIEDVGFSVYGSPIESTTYKFAKTLKKRFGIIEGVTDKDYITNSYHVHVTEEIGAFKKLSFEAEFQALSPGGAISYIEMPAMFKNIEAILSVMTYIYENIMYAELNTRADNCQVCNFEGELLIDENFEWYCPICGNRDEGKMQVIRRVCGYISSNYFNEGRTQEVSERVLHLGNVKDI